LDVSISLQESRGRIGIGLDSESVIIITRSNLNCIVTTSRCRDNRGRATFVSTATSELVGLRNRHAIGGAYPPVVLISMMTLAYTEIGASEALRSDIEDHVTIDNKI
jgi:hypothetical protein